MLANLGMHRLITEGVQIELPDGLGGVRAEHLQVIDFAEPGRNAFLAVNQFTVVEGPVERRPDVIVFVNGLPLVIFEFKNTRDASATIEKAYTQLQTYHKQLTRPVRLQRAAGDLGRHPGQTGRHGCGLRALPAMEDRHGPRGVARESGDADPRGLHASNPHGPDPALRGVRAGGAADRQEGGGLPPVPRGAARRGTTVEASRLGGDRRGGVVWHTQGSGKSLTMVFYAGKLVVQPELSNPTLVVLTDRNDLDDQLFGTFSRCAGLLRQVPEQVKARSELRQKLGERAAGGVVFTTIQKFLPEERGDAFPTLSERRNIIVIADEAHRSQYGLSAKMGKDGVLTYGFAKHIRDALPNATFLGFTGTPIETKDADTRAIFGDYIDIYDVQRAVEDGATVPIYYESRLVRLKPDDAAWETLDEEFEEITEHEETASREKLKTKWAALEALVGAPERIRQVAQDLDHPLRGASGRDGGQGHGGGHVPPHLRGAVRRAGSPAPRMGRGGRSGGRPQGGHDGQRERQPGLAGPHPQQGA